MNAVKEQHVIFPIFEECKNFTLDSFWRDEFSKLACNKFPPGMRYDSLHHNIILKTEGKKTEVLALPENNPSEAFQVVMKILKGRYDMRSSRDLKVQKKAIEDAMKKRDIDLNCEFKNIKPRHLKDHLIMEYLLKLKQTYLLTNTEFKHLVSVVQLGFQFKSLTPGDVNYADGVVSGIEGLVYDEKRRRFSTPDAATPPPCKQEKNTCPDRFYSTLKKFIHEDKARVKKFC